VDERQSWRQRYGVLMNDVLNLSAGAAKKNKKPPHDASVAFEDGYDKFAEDGSLQ
jgi:hypothetical protein